MFYMCPFDTLMMFTTKISVNSIYRIRNVIIIPVVWLYIVIIFVIISFSAIVSWVFICLLLICVGVIVIMMGRVICVARIILFDGLPNVLIAWKS